MKIKNIYPANLKRKDKQLWDNNYNYKSEAYIFTDKNECLFELKKYMENILVVDTNQYIYMIIKTNYEDIIIEDKNIFLDVKEIKGGIIFKTFLRVIYDKWDILFSYWGESNRIQLFLPKDDEKISFDKLECIAKHYRINYTLYIGIITNCRYIISDTGDGEEFELIRDVGN